MSLRLFPPLIIPTVVHLAPFLLCPPHILAEIRGRCIAFPLFFKLFCSVFFFLEIYRLTQGLEEADPLFPFFCLIPRQRKFLSWVFAFSPFSLPLFFYVAGQVADSLPCPLSFFFDLVKRSVLPFPPPFHTERKLISSISFPFFHHRARWFGFIPTLLPLSPAQRYRISAGSLKVIVSFLFSLFLPSPLDRGRIIKTLKSLSGPCSQMLTRVFPSPRPQLPL